MSAGVYLIARIGQYYIRGEFGITPIQRSSRSSAATWLAYTCTRVSISARNGNATGISYILGQFLKNYIQPNLPESPSSWAVQQMVLRAYLCIIEIPVIPIFLVASNEFDR